MSRTVTSAVADLRSELSELSGAWAAWRDAASNAQLAADANRNKIDEINRKHQLRVSAIEAAITRVNDSVKALVDAQGSAGISHSRKKVISAARR